MTRRKVVTKRAAGAVPLFAYGRKPARRMLPALERSLRRLEVDDVDEGPGRDLYRAALRDLAEEIDDRRQTESLYALATGLGKLDDLWQRLTGGDPSAGTLDELRAFLSAAPVDGEV